jgi:hypothetical protein
LKTVQKNQTQCLLSQDEGLSKMSLETQASSRRGDILKTKGNKK